MLIIPDIQQKLLEKGVSFLHPGQFSLPDRCVFEPPCSLKRMQVAHSLEMGAFSYAKSGYYFAVKIGRYCSIEENVQIGRGSHPVAWGSTSPVLYQDHFHVFNQRVEEAKDFRTNAKFLPVKMTTIGNDVYIGYGALINQGVTIGDGAVIKPMSVVSKDVPPFAIVEGNPGVITGMRFPVRLAARALTLAWWRFAVWDLLESHIEDAKDFMDAVKQKIDAGLRPYNPERLHISTFAEPASPTLKVEDGAPSARNSN